MSPAAGATDPRLPPWATVRTKRLAHITRVSDLVSSWADAMSLPGAERERWLRAVWLHDAMRDAPPDELARWAGGAAGPVALLHGPASAERARSLGERDQGVLDAVRYHSVGFAGWDSVGQALYCADSKLVYPIVSDIPILLIDEALPASSIGR